MPFSLAHRCHSGRAQEEHEARMQAETHHDSRLILAWYFGRPRRQKVVRARVCSDPRRRDCVHANQGVPQRGPPPPSVRYSSQRVVLFSRPLPRPLMVVDGCHPTLASAASPCLPRCFSGSVDSTEKVSLSERHAACALPPCPLNHKGQDILSSVPAVKTTKCFRTRAWVWVTFRRGWREC